MSDNRLLIIDDDVTIVKLVSSVAAECGYESSSAANRSQFLEQLTNFSPTFILLDLYLQDEDGIQLLHDLEMKGVQIPFALMSGCDEKVLSATRSLAKSLNLNVIEAFQKPVPMQVIKDLLKNKIWYRPLINPEILDNAIKNNQFILQYQPQINLKDATLWGLEGLARWQSTLEELIYPDQFISHIEETELIHTFTEKTLELALSDVPHIQQISPNCKMGVNISGKFLKDISFPDKLLDLTKRYQVNPQNVILEVTETAFHANKNTVMNILTRLRIHHFMVSMDDFGTGYSSLIELYRMPFNQIKIDKEFVMTLSKDKQSQVIVRSLIGLFKDLGITVIAEGIEDKASLDLLCEYGCDVGQGFLLAKPMYMKALNAWIAEHDPGNLKNKNWIKNLP